MINITDVIGTNADIERRIQDQLDRPKAMFSEDGPVCQSQALIDHSVYSIRKYCRMCIRLEEVHRRLWHTEASLRCPKGQRGKSLT